MNGILSYGTYVPRGRLDRSQIKEVARTGGGKGTRSVASFDEDTTTMGVQAARRALSGLDGSALPAALWFVTADPTYLDKTNATAIHAALGLDPRVLAADFGGAVRSGIAALSAAAHTDRTTLVVGADMRTGLPGSAEESSGGDAAAAVIFGSGRVVAELIGEASATAEFTDRWRAPGDPTSKYWEERFAETQYIPMAQGAWSEALKSAGVSAEEIDHIVVTGPHARSARGFVTRATLTDRLVDDLADSVGWTGTASPGLLLSRTLEAASANQVIVVVSMADGVDILVFRTTDALTEFHSSTPGLTDLGATAPLSYGTYLAWRGMLPVQPPNRPEPARVSASASARNRSRKFTFGGRSDVHGRITTFTIDRLVYSPSPPVIFAVVDFEDGSRTAVELTDVDENDVGIGDMVEMTFRRLSTADGIHNYFWKARPLQ
jgi:hydroxymethylglutaryl-CoA synthase